MRMRYQLGPSTFLPQHTPRLFVGLGLSMVIGLFPILLGGIAGTPAASAAQSSVGLGTATTFAVLAGQTVTNTGPSKISGDLGVSPGTAVTGAPEVVNGTEHKDDDVARQAQSDLTTGYVNAAGRTPATPVSSDLGGQKLAPGVYQAASAMGLTGTVTLDGQNDPNAVFIFQAGTTLITAPNSTVALMRGAHACNIFWQVGSSATLGTDTTFVGSVLAYTSATVQTRTTLAGRVLARNGQVSLDTNTITRPMCNASTTPTPTPTPSDEGDASGTGGTGSTGGSGSGGTQGSGGTDTGDNNGSGGSGTDGTGGSGGSGTGGSSTGANDGTGGSGTGGTGGTGGISGADSRTGEGSGTGTDVQREGRTDGDPSVPGVPLARTGSPIGTTLLLAALALTLGAVARRLGRTATVPQH